VPRAQFHDLGVCDRIDPVSEDGVKNEEKATESKTPAKRPYLKPELRTFGTIDKLTAAASGALPEFQDGTKNGP